MKSFDLNLSQAPRLSASFSAVSEIPQTGKWNPTWDELSLMDKTTTTVLKRALINVAGADVEDVHPLLAVYNADKSLKGFYGPKVYMVDGELCLKVGEMSYPLTHSSKPGDWSVEVSFTENQYKRPSVVIYCYNGTGSEDVEITWQVPVGLRELEEGEKYPSPMSMTNMLKKKDKTGLGKWVSEPVAYAPALSYKNLEAGVYTVTGYDSFKGSDGPSFKMKIQPTFNENGEPTQTIREVMKKGQTPSDPVALSSPTWVYASKDHSGLLSQSPVISPEKPAYLFIQEVKAVKNGYSVTASLRLDPEAIAPDDVTDDDLAGLF